MEHAILKLKREVDFGYQHRRLSFKVVYAKYAALWYEFVMCRVSRSGRLSCTRRLVEIDHKLRSLITQTFTPAPDVSRHAYTMTITQHVEKITSQLLLDVEDLENGAPSPEFIPPSTLIEYTYTFYTTILGVRTSKDGTLRKTIHQFYRALWHVVRCKQEGWNTKNAGYALITHGQSMGSFLDQEIWKTPPT